ncbi:MAG TPA: NrsF family protein [Bryobacteraceae bacterium]|nr:NrsF family protein [Bryobacteraceae bacterium]
MNCQEVERLIRGQARPTRFRLPDPAVAHLSQCPVCRGLAELLTRRDAAPPAPMEILRNLEQQIAQDLHAVKPMRPAAYYAAGFTAWFVAFAAAGGWMLKPLAVGVMSPWLCATIWAALGISAGLVIMSLVGQMTPGCRGRVNPVRLPFAILLILPAFFSTMLPHRAEADFWRLGWICLICGLTVFVPAAVAYGLLLRQGALLSPRLAGATLGLLGGLTGTTVLEIHCPLQTALHVVTWHLGVPLITTAGCLMMAILIGRGGAHAS